MDRVAGSPEDHAEMLAHHYLTALDLDRTAGVKSEELKTRARLQLRGRLARVRADRVPAARRF
jgi:hypothetical protein